MRKLPAHERVQKATRPLFIHGRNKSMVYRKILSHPKSAFRNLSPLAKAALRWN